MEPTSAVLKRPVPIRGERLGGRGKSSRKVAIFLFSGALLDASRRRPAIGFEPKKSLVMESKSLSLAKPFLGKEVEVIIDRPLGSKHPKHGFAYEANYGYISDTKAPDGEELDAYVLGIDDSVVAFKGVCVAIIHRLDDDDDKLVVVPKELGNMSDEKIKKATNFQEQYFTSVIIRV